MLLAEQGISDNDVYRVTYANALTAYGQSGQMREADWASAAIDQRAAMTATPSCAAARIHASKPTTELGAALRFPLLHLLTAITLGMGGAAATAADQCLSKAELMDVARMGSVMGLGGALKRCGNCLGDRYRKTVDNYEASGMLVEFRRAEAAVQSSRSKFEYADDLVRVTARKFASDLSADCTACERTADTVGTLDSADARSKLYDAEAAKITQMPAYKSCP